MASTAIKFAQEAGRVLTHKLSTKGFNWAKEKLIEPRLPKIEHKNLTTPKGENVGKKFMEYQEVFVLKPGWKRWDKYIAKRGWNFDEIQQNLLKGTWRPHLKENWLNPGNSMSLVTNPNTGKSLIIDNLTKEIILLGKKGYDFNEK